MPQDAFSTGAMRQSDDLRGSTSLSEPGANYRRIERHDDAVSLVFGKSCQVVFGPAGDFLRVNRQRCSVHGPNSRPPSPRSRRNCSFVPAVHRGGAFASHADTDSATTRRAQLQRAGRQHRGTLTGRAICDCGRVIFWSDRDRPHDATPGQGADSLQQFRDRSHLQGSPMARDTGVVQATDAGILVASVPGRQVRRCGACSRCGRDCRIGAGRDLVGSSATGVGDERDRDVRTVCRPNALFAQQ